MKIVSYNVNGIRASLKLGLIDWLKDYDADVYCLQEVRCNQELTNSLLFGNKQAGLFDSEEMNRLQEYYPIYNCGKIAGYAGTLILSKIKPDQVFFNMGDLWNDD